MLRKLLRSSTKNVMDKIWDRNLSKSRALAVVAGMKKPNGDAEPTKS